MESITSVGAGEWDSLVERSRAPVFYTHAFLSAYERDRLQPTPLCYLLVRDGPRLVAAVPCQLHEGPDPLATLAKIVPGEGGGPVLLSHMLHCYDTNLPAEPLRAEIVECVVHAMRRTAADRGARWHGFANVRSESPLATLLRKHELVESAMPERYRRDVAGCTTDDFLASMRSDRRIEYRRHVRRAFEGGVRVEVRDGNEARIDALVGLLADLAGRHAAGAYYPPEPMVRFVRALGATAEVVEVWSDDGTLLAGSVNFVHDGTFHMWAAGARYGVTQFSPYYVLVLESLRVAVEGGAVVAEGGRGNGEFKQRLGFRPVPLSGFVGKADG